ncbi:MAG: aminotransferase class V-fold PLP-dependent enzyme [Sphingomonadaceae bacterium]
MQGVYLDWAATAPLKPEAADAMAEAAARLQSGEWANPSSQHRPGRAARRALERARESLAGFFNVPPDSLVFTSGGTEALALALGGWATGPRLVLATEHAAVLEAAPDAARLPVDADGLLVPSALDGIPAGALVAVQQANNETGVVQDVAAIAGAVHAAGSALVCDAVQAAGKLPLPAAADLVAVSAHKLGGPAGTGALIVRCRERLRAIQRGGGQEQGLRGGTENLVGILGFAAAAEAFDAGFPARAARLQQRLEAGARAIGARVNAEMAPRVPTISSLHLPGVPAATQLMAMDLAGIAVSQGAACSSGTLRPSAVLAAMGLADAASQSLRVSLGWTTTEADIDRFLAVLGDVAARRRAA